MARKKHISITETLGEAVSDVANAASAAATGSEIGMLELAVEDELKPISAKALAQGEGCSKKERGSKEVKEADEKQTCRKTSPAIMSIRPKTSFGAVRRSSFFKASPATARNVLPLLAFCFSIRRWIEKSILSASFFAASRHSTRFLQGDRRIGAERQ